MKNGDYMAQHIYGGWPFDGTTEKDTMEERVAKVKTAQ